MKRVSVIGEKKTGGGKAADRAGLTLIIQLDTWLMLRPVAWHKAFFSSSLGYG